MATNNPGFRFLDELNVSRETIERLEIYDTLLRKWNPAINLVAKSTLHDARDRHFSDSLQLWSLKPTSASNWVDLGSGGGFPGMVIAILAFDLAPKMKVTLIDSDARKSAFLTAVKQETGIEAEILAGRAESLAPMEADVLSARALAPLPALLDHAKRHMAADGIAVFPKGKSYEYELTAARKYWTFDLTETPSRTDPEGVILTIRGLARVNDTKTR